MKTMKVKCATLLFGLLSVIAAVPSYAQFARAEQAVGYRRGVMFVQNAHLNILKSVVKGDRPFNAQEVANSAAVIDFVSRQAWMGFVPDSETSASRAKPDIWTQADKFRQTIEKFQGSTAKLAAVAKTNDMAALRAAVGEVDQGCTSCHDAFHK